MENNMNQNGNQNEIKLTVKDRVMGFVRRNFTWKKVAGAAALVGTGYAVGYAVGHKKTTAVPEEAPVEEPKAEEPVEEELYGIDDEQLAEMGLKYEPNEAPVEETETKEAEA